MALRYYMIGDINCYICQLFLKLPAKNFIIDYGAIKMIIAKRSRTRLGIENQINEEGVNSALERQ